MIIIVDFGSQTAHLIGRRLRQLGVETVFAEPSEVAAAVAEHKPTGLILSGGPSSVYEDGAPTLDAAVLTKGIPVLGICYGWQLMAHLLGGEVQSASKEYGPEIVTFSQSSLGMGAGSCRVIMSHGDSVVTLPPGFTVVGSTARVPFTAVSHEAQRLYGVQFHPEVDHTEHGMDLLRHFVTDVCGEKLNPLVLDPKKMSADIAKTVGKDQVICAVSGGVDSTVAAALIGRAIGRQLIPVYIESGLMRAGTLEHVQAIFTDHIPAQLEVVHAEDRFMTALKGQTDPEAKRKIIGKLYVELFQEVAQKHSDAKFLGQGTIYSDVIESKGSKHASKIKSHHNVGGLPEELGFTLLEPLRQLYKDEVRALGRLLDLPEKHVMQQPMPGPGYAIRVRGEVTPERLAQVKIADQVVIDEITAAGLYDSVFQCFAIMSGAYSTAVKGDARAFAEVVAIRAYESTDIMTSQWAQLPYDVLQKMASRIVDEVPHVSRVVYDITTKPPATMEWE